MCYGARSTFTGMQHSGDINEGTDLLHHIKIDERLEAGKEFAVFVSGFQYTKLTRFQERNPVVMVANHAEKVSKTSIFMADRQANMSRLCTSSQFRLMLPRLETPQSAPRWWSSVKGPC